MKRAIRGYQVRKKILSDPNINEMKIARAANRGAIRGYQGNEKTE